MMLVHLLIITAPFLQQEPEQVPVLADIPLLSTMFTDRQQEVVPDPELRWDGETEDIYRRAMHLIQVRAKYDEGVGLLLSIADSQQVIQVPGQASWVLAQAALAMMRSGRAAEAEAMLPGIRNGAVGTDFERQVEFRLSQIAALQEQDAQPLDDSFRNFLWERLRGYPRDEKDRGSDIIGYGRLALPYLEELIRGQLALGAAGHDADIVQASKAAQFALRLADEPFAHRFAALLAQYPPLTTRVLLDRATSNGFDATAERAQVVFYRKLTQDGDASRRELGTGRLIHALRRSGGEGDASILFELAQGGDADQRAAVLESLRNGTIYASEAWTTFAARAADSEDAELRAAARWGMLRDGNREALARYADTEGRLVDKLRYLATFEGVDADAVSRRGGNNPSEASVRELTAAAYEAMREVGAYEALPYGWGVGGDPGEADRARITALAGDSHPGVAAYACLVASQSRVDALIQAVFQTTAGPLRNNLLGTVTSRGRWNYDAETARTLLQMAQAGDERAFRFLDETGMRGLEVAELAASGLEWTRHTAGRGWYQHMSESVNAQDWARVADVVTYPGLSVDTRNTGLIHLQQNSRQEFLRAALTAGSWQVGDAQPTAWLFHNLFNGLIGRHGREGFPEDVSDELFVACLDAAWSAAKRMPASAEHIDLEQQFERLWERSPDAAYAQARRLLQSDADLELYMGRNYNIFSRNGSAQAQRLILELMKAGVWDAERRSVPIWDDTQPEFESLVRHLFATPGRADDAMDLLRSADPRWRDTFAQELDDAWSDPELAYEVLRIHLDKPSIKQQVDKLLAAWEVEGLRNRPVFLAAMGTTLDERVVPVLLDQLGSTDPKCREAAQAALERMREIREQREFWAAWEATGSAVSPAVALIQKLQSDNRDVRLAAIQSLGTLKATEALPFLIELLEDEDVDIRLAAAAALAKINDAD